MGLIGGAIQETRASFQAALTTFKDPGDWLVRWFGGRAVSSGATVTEQSALGVTAVYACIQVLTDTIGSLPLGVFERLSKGGRREAREHPLWALLHDEPNPDMTSYSWRESLQGHLGTWGNGYSLIVQDGGGRAQSIWPLRPDRVIPKRKNGILRYHPLNPDGSEGDVLTPSQVIHIAGLGFDGLIGYSPVRLHREAIGLAMATEEHGGRLFGNQARPSGVLKTEKKLGRKGRKNLEESWKSMHAGDKGGGIAVLEDGLSWQQIGFPPEDAQFLQTRKFQVVEAARIYRMQLHKIQDMDAATFSNIEHQSIEHVVDTIVPWAVRWEQELTRKLLLPAERGRFFIAFKIKGLLRGDIKTRMEAYKAGRQWGWYSVNDVLRLEDENPIGPQGDVYMVPMNMVPADQFASGENGGGDVSPAARALLRDIERETAGLGLSALNIVTRASSADNRRTIQKAHFPLLRREAERVVRKEVKQIRRQARKMILERDSTDFRVWLEDFYREQPAEVAAAFLPVFESMGQEIRASAAQELGFDPDDAEELSVFVRDYADTLGRRHALASQGQIAALLNQEGSPEEVLGRVDQRLTEWEEKRPDKIASQERTKFGSSIAKAAWISLGVLTLRWVTFGKNCPFCDEMSGKVVSVTENFAPKGDTTKGEGRPPLKSYGAVGHPPLHGGCLPGDARVASSLVSATSERWFDGELVVIRTASGKQLTSTPNHPILTDRGWVAADLLDIGSHVVSSRAREWDAAVVGNNQHVPSTIEEITKSFRESPKVVSVPMPCAPEAFHGDGEGSEVAVISADRELWRELHATFFEQPSELEFRIGDAEPALLFGQSGSLQFSRPVPPTLRRTVGGGALDRPFGGGLPLPGQQAGFRATADRNIPFDQMSTDHGPRYSERLGNGEFRLAGDVFLDQVIRVERNPFHGEVFNLQTEKGFYVANGIITHNCDCSVVPG